MGFKLGALPPVRPYGLAELSAYIKGKPPTPPAAFLVPSVPSWPMFLNDTYGDCVVAGAGHAVQAWNAEVLQADHIPTDSEIKQVYFSESGGADSGLVEASFLRDWQQQGFWGHKIAAYAPVNPKSLFDMHAAIAYYGLAYLGVALPASAQDQFAHHAPWTVVPHSPIEGGHCIVAVGYTQQYVQVITWGQVVNVSYPWLAKYCTEAWAIIPSQFVEAGRGPSLDLRALQADLASLR